MRRIFDGHNDVLIAPDFEDFVTGREGGHLDLPRMAEAGMRGGIFAVFTRTPRPAGARRSRSSGPGSDGPAPELAHPVVAAAASAAAGRLFALERAGALRVARTIADIDAGATDGGAPVAVLHLEGAEAIDPALEALELWHAAGLRSLGPFWSRPNAFGHGVRFGFPASPDTGPGLTPAGKLLVRRCAELGIAVDLSHANEAGFWDVARLEAAPLIASHSGVHAISASSRNLTDEQIDRIGASGGLVGIVLAPAFLSPEGSNDPDAISLELIARHALHVADRIGPEHVALGSDFDGSEMPTVIGDVRGVPALLEALAEAGFSAAELDAFAWGNWRRVLGRCWHE